MVPLTNQGYVIACRLGHEAKTHQSGFCGECRKNGRDESAFYLFEDRHIETIYGSRGVHVSSATRCAECGHYVVDQLHYLCPDCRNG